MQMKSTFYQLQKRFWPPYYIFQDNTQNYDAINTTMVAMQTERM